MRPADPPRSAFCRIPCAVQSVVLPMLPPAGAVLGENFWSWPLKCIDCRAPVAQQLPTTCIATIMLIQYHHCLLIELHSVMWLAVSVAKLGAARKLGADPAAPATVPAHGQNGVCGLWHHPLARSFAVFSAILPSPDILYVSKNLEHFRFLNNSVRHHPILIRFGAEYLENAYWIFHLTYFLISYSDQRSQWSILKSDSNVS